MNSVKKKAEISHKFYEMANENWPIFSEYTIRKNKEGRLFICPGENATLTYYDPWATRNKDGLKRSNSTYSTLNRESQPPYIQFVTLLHKLGYDFRKCADIESYLATPEQIELDSEKEKLLLDWCSSFGLLGILLHEVKMFRFPFLKHLPEDDFFKSIAFFKRQGRLVANEVYYKRTKHMSNRGDLWSLLDWESGRVELESYGTTSQYTDLHDKFYWSDPYWIADNYFPFTENIIDVMTTGHFDDFWKEYCEPLDFFVDKAAMLGRGLDILKYPDLGKPYEFGIMFLSMLIGEAPVSYLLIDGKVRPKFRTPSILSTFALMALEHAAGGARFLDCKNDRCGRGFTTHRKDQKFCSEGCNHAHHSRENKKRTKAASKKEIKLFCDHCEKRIPEPKSNRDYCGRKCKDAARYQRKKKEKLVAKNLSKKQ